MTELSPDARSLLDAGRHAHDPPPSARHRVRARVLAEVAAPPRPSLPRPLALVALAVVVALLAALALRRTPAPTSAPPVTPAPTLAPPQRTDAPPAPVPTVSPAITAVPTVAPAPVVAPPQRPARPAPDRTDTLAAELRLLREARAQLASHDVSGALATLDQHARRFAHGQLTEEREAVRSLARCATRPDPSEADRFARAWPASPSIARVRRACTDAP